MYIDFYSKNLNEYNKIIQTLNSIEFSNSEVVEANFDVICNMADTFYNNMDFRYYYLRNRIKGIHSFKEWRNLKRQMELLYSNLNQTLENWTNIYQNVVQETVSTIQNEDKHVHITGYSKLFKLNKMKKKKK